MGESKCKVFSGGHDFCVIRHIAHCFIGGRWGDNSILFWQYFCFVDLYKGSFTIDV